MRFFKNKLDRAMDNQARAFGIFTQAMDGLKKANSELENLMYALGEKEIKIRHDKGTAIRIMSENKAVINNLEKMLGVNNEG